MGVCVYDGVGGSGGREGDGWMVGRGGGSSGESRGLTITIIGLMKNT